MLNLGQRQTTNGLQQSAAAFCQVHRPNLISRGCFPGVPVGMLGNMSRTPAVTLPQTVQPLSSRVRRHTALVADSPTSSHQPSPFHSYDDAVLMQSFGWDSCKQPGFYKMLQSKIPDMKAAGVTHLWLPPPSQSVSPQGYLPGQLYNLNSSFGNKEQLQELNRALSENGIKPMADIVINHRCADEQVDGVWNKFRDDVDHTGKRIDWGKWAITSNDPAFQGTGNPDTGDDFGPAPDLDHANRELREALKQWLQWLKDDIGFQGWRFDFARGFAAKYIAEYVQASTTAEEFNVSEYWVDLKWGGSYLEPNQDEARQRVVNFLDGAQKTSCAFDFVTKGILQFAAAKTEYWRLKDKQGKPPGVMGWWPSRAVTFIDNHDTGSSQQHWPFPPELVGLGYAYILTHPGIPCIFWEHYFTWGDKLKASIKDLVALRKRQGITSRSKLEILDAEADMYVARIDGRVVIKLGPKYEMGSFVPKVSDGWKLACSGKDFAVWEKQ